MLDLGNTALSLAMAAAAGMVGCFAVMRRMTLAADAMSHVALPGIGLALILRLNPLLGALATLLCGALLIWSIESRTRLATETVIGVAFSVALAIGATIASGEELIDALLGTPGRLGAWEIALGLAGSAAVIAFVLRARHALVLSLVSRDIALTSGVGVARLDLYYLLAFALTIGLGLRFLGVLLMGSLIIIPAATAKRLARSLDQMFVIAVSAALASTLAGSYLGAVAGRSGGPYIVIVAGGLFALTLARGRAT